MILDRPALVLLMSVLSIACVATLEGPGTGDLSFRLTWTGTADVDLYVQSPLGEPVNYGLRHAASGGELDVDCNFRSEEFESSEFRHMCEMPMENIYWPHGTAPRGEYEFWLLLPNPEGMTAEDTFTLEVRLSDRVVWSARGKVADLEQRAPVYRLRHPEGEITPVD